MTVSVDVMVGGVAIPLVAGAVHGGAYGSTGHMSATTTRTLLAADGVDLLALAQDAPTILPVDVFVTPDGGGRVHLFGGEYLKAKWSFARDTVTITARDWSGLLVDQKRVLTDILGGNVGALAVGEVAGAGVSTTNQTLSALVSAIAKQFGLTPDIRLASGGDVSAASAVANENPEIGTVFGNYNDTILTAVPQSLWGILMRLARDTGNIVYCTPDKALVFGVPGAGLSTLTYAWKPATADGVQPLLTLDIEHNPRRNLTFRVLVLSYDPTSGQATKGQAYVIGANFSTSTGSTVHAGAWGGPQASAISNAIGTGASSKKNAIPLYTFHVDGLTQAQANIRAQAIAADISRRELIVHTRGDLIPGIRPGQPGKLAGDIEAVFGAHDYFATSFSHEFSMPRGESNRAQLQTSVTLLDVQPAGEGNATTQVGA